MMKKMVLATLYFEARNLGLYEIAPEREATETHVDDIHTCMLDAA